MPLQSLGQPANPERMVQNFQTDGYFRTYQLESSSSFSANCHVVLSLSGYRELNGHEHRIEKALTFLLRAEASGPISDKWNHSPQYCRMLFVQTLLSVLKKRDENWLESLPTNIIYEKVPGGICRLLSQTLLAQSSDGSWADSLEFTAYSILTITHCLSLPWTTDLKVQLKDSIFRGRQYPRHRCKEVAREVYNFLLAHITHNQDNVLFAKSKGSVTKDGAQFVNQERAYIDWVRTTASDDTICPFSFLFFTALISERGRICFEGAQASYFSRSLCRQLVTMCRQYNDYGSAKRDAEEGNLNSLDVPEFQSHTNRADGCSKANGSDIPVVRPEDGNVASPTRAASNEQKSGENEAKAPERAPVKEDLMAIAEFERSCMQLALEKLSRISPPATVHKLQVFIDVTDMFGQIYVQRDEQFHVLFDSLSKTASLAL
ncbi:MAG: hypothetical protein Q9173_002594 [Seirophora scorigena]